MESRETHPPAIVRAAITPKAFLYQKYGSKAVYKIEEIKDPSGNGCPGLVITQQSRNLFRCCLELPELSVTSEAFTKKKDAEQSAAKLAIEKLGIQPKSTNLTIQETWDELTSRLSYLFSNEIFDCFLDTIDPSIVVLKFLSTSHPLVGHFRAAVQREGTISGLIPLSILPACDTKLKNLCKSINPWAESSPSLIVSILMKAARLSDSICIFEGKPGVYKHNPYSPEIMQALINLSSGPEKSIQIEAIYISCSVRKPVEAISLDVAPTEYYMDAIAQRLGVSDCSNVLISRSVGKASSETRLYFVAPEDPLLASDSSNEVLSNAKEFVCLELELNTRASYFSGQKIYGDAVMAAVGYTWKSTDLFHEDVSLGSYYRMLLGRMPDGNYKLCREAILAAELPNSFTTRSNWRGTLPKDLLCMFCRHHSLSEPVFSIKSIHVIETSKKLKLSELTNESECSNGAMNLSTDGGQASTFRCDLKIFSKVQDVIIECSTEDSYRKQGDAIQSVALKALTWLNKYFKDLDMPLEKLSVFGDAHGIRLHAEKFSREFVLCLSVHDTEQGSILRKCGSLEQLDTKQEIGMTPFSIEGPDSGIFPFPGSLACISYGVSLVREGSLVLKKSLETKDDFEFEIGVGAVVHQLEASVTQLSVNQSARFITKLPSKDLILAAAGDYAESFSLLSFQGCFLEYSVKLLGVIEPLEDRMEQALFSPPLSKQRVEYALRHIHESHATSLVDFGCGSGSLLDSLLEHSTSLETIVGVDISQKSLCRAAKMLHSKLDVISNATTGSMKVKSALLYDGSILDFDPRLYGFDIGTCLEVIEHMQEDQACQFGDAVLSSFCPNVLIVSTPNYEYNPILQNTILSNREDDPEAKAQSQPFKFRNHDHKFEWTREQFNNWASDLALRHNYNVEFGGVGGSADMEPGFASQIAVFRRKTQHQATKGLGDGDSSHHYKVIWEWSNNRSRSAL